MKLHCKIAYDVEPGRTPRPGDLLQSMPMRRQQGSVYLILEAREVRRRTRRGPLIRYMLTCQRWTLPIPESRIEGKIHPLFWYPRTRRKR